MSAACAAPKAPRLIAAAAAIINFFIIPDPLGRRRLGVPGRVDRPSPSIPMQNAASYSEALDLDNRVSDRAPQSPGESEPAPRQPTHEYVRIGLETLGQATAAKSSSRLAQGQQRIHPTRQEAPMK